MFNRSVMQILPLRNSLHDMVQAFYSAPSDALFQKIKSIAGQPSHGHPGFSVVLSAGDIKFHQKQKVEKSRTR
jgi:hypothetical protein